MNIPIEGEGSLKIYEDEEYVFNVSMAKDYNEKQTEYKKEFFCVVTDAIKTYYKHLVN